MNRDMTTPLAIPTAEKNRNASVKRLALMALFAFILRLMITPYINELMNPEHIQCWEQGNSAAALVQGHGFGSPFDAHYQPSAIMPPVFPLIVAAIFKVFGVRTVASVYAVHAFDCLVSALAIFPIFLVARNSFGCKTGWWTAWAWVFSPYGIYFAAEWPWSTHLLLLALFWLLYLAQKMEDNSRLLLWAGFGLLAGVTALTEPSVLTVVPFLMLLAAWRLWCAGKRWLMPGLVASVVMWAAISPWLIRNAVVFHKFIPMRDSMGLELWMGNNGSNLRWTSDDIHPLHDPQEQADYDRGEMAYMAHKSVQAKAYIAQHPGWYAGMCARRAVYVWTGFWSFNKAYMAEEPMDLSNIPFATGLTLLGIAGLVLSWRKSRYDAIRFGGVMFLFPMMYYFSHPEPYHLRPLDPLIAMLGCHAILVWRSWAKENVHHKEKMLSVVTVES
jgi:4-amino-4-deoxy-L-arabinose transferase-like glycosyltransferase